jgi:hypothetical protein
MWIWCFFFLEVLTLFCGIWHPCSSACRDHSLLGRDTVQFGTCFLMLLRHLVYEWRWRQLVPLKHGCSSARPRCVTSQKAVVLKIVCCNDKLVEIRSRGWFYFVSADVFTTFAATRLRQLYNDIYEAGLREHSIGELSNVCWGYRLELEDCWQEDVTSKCDTITRYVHYYDLVGCEGQWYRSDA